MYICDVMLLKNHTVLGTRVLQYDCTCRCCKANTHFVSAVYFITVREKKYLSALLDRYLTDYIVSELKKKTI
jgi:hypothetical protein